MTHLMEVSTQFFEDIFTGVKSYALVKNERPYKDGDDMFLQEIENKEFTSRELKLKINLVETAAAGLKSDYCILSFKLIS